MITALFDIPEWRGNQQHVASRLKDFSDAALWVKPCLRLVSSRASCGIGNLTVKFDREEEFECASQLCEHGWIRKFSTGGNRRITTRRRFTSVFHYAVQQKIKDCIICDNLFEALRNLSSDAGSSEI